MIVIFHKDIKKHNYINHIENSKRTDYLLKGLKESGSKIIEPELLDKNFVKKILYKVHNKEYVDKIFDIIENTEEIGFLDSDTYISKGTLNSIIASISSIYFSLDYPNCFILTRPPGHHRKESYIRYRFASWKRN